MSERLDEQVRDALQLRRGEWPGIAERCRVSHSWLSKFVRGHIPNPGYATLKRLHAELVGADGVATSLAQDVSNAS